VLCEKPLARTAAAAERAFDAAEREGRLLAEAFMYRHHPQTLKVQDLVKSGALGEVRLMRGSFTYVLSRDGDVRLDPAMGGGSIWDIGCYPINYARAILGADPLEVYGWQITGATGIDETFVGQMRFERDVFAQFDSSFALPFHTFVEIVGSEATLNIPRPFKPGIDEKIYLTREDRTETIRVKGQELYIGEVEDMADAILLGREPRISLEDSRANVAAILGLLESARSGKAVLLA
jgi:predicted dehydrogenase